MATCWYHFQRYFCCGCCKPKSLLQNQVTDEDWGLNCDDERKNTSRRSSNELIQKPSEIETADLAETESFASKNERGSLTSSTQANDGTQDIPGETKLMKADLTPVKGRDGWSKYIKPTNLTTDEFEAEEIDENDIRMYEGEEDMDKDEEPLNQVIAENDSQGNEHTHDDEFTNDLVAKQ